MVKIAMMLSLIALFACNGSPTGTESSVTGTVTYRERIALPPSSVLHLQLADVSLQDVPSIPLEDLSIANPGPVPIPFEIPYDPEDIDPRHTYAVSARITDGDQLLFINATAYDVITRGNPNHVDMILEMVP